MNDILEDQEDRTRGFVPPEPRGLGLRWIAGVVVVVLVAAVVVTKLLPPAKGSVQGATPAGAVAK